MLGSDDDAALARPDERQEMEHLRKRRHVRLHFGHGLGQVQLGLEERPVRQFTGEKPMQVTGVILPPLQVAENELLQRTLLEIRSAPGGPIQQNLTQIL